VTSARGRTELDRAWESLVALVMETRGDWRRKVAEATGLSFSRVRALRRLAGGPLTLRELAESMTTDAPAATVLVNDLEARGLVQRRSHPTDRRAKMVSLTAAGKRTLGAARTVTEHAPDALTALPAEDIAALVRIVRAVRP
jgi:DNA-binding MarR family transcriptional regulator